MSRIGRVQSTDYEDALEEQQSSAQNQQPYDDFDDDIVDAESLQQLHQEQRGSSGYNRYADRRAHSLAAMQLSAWCSSRHNGSSSPSKHTTDTVRNRQLPVNPKVVYAQRGDVPLSDSDDQQDMRSRFA